MKKYLIISLLFLFFGCSQNEYNSNDLIVMDDGLYTVKSSDKPISGKVYGYYGEESNLKKVYMGNLLKGRKEGTWKNYDDLGITHSFEYNSNDLIVMDDGLYTVKFSDKPISGKVYGDYGEEGNLLKGKKEGTWKYYAHYTYKKFDMVAIFEGVKYGRFENGQKRGEQTWKNGERDGLGTWWHANGQKISEITWKDGERDGLDTEWYENGQKKREEIYKDGERDGLDTEWYENGQKKREEIYKDGERNGLDTEWYENGQKKREQTLKNGRRDGLDTEWYENGQKKREEIYKDGERISGKVWNSDGLLKNGIEKDSSNLEDVGNPFYNMRNLGKSETTWKDGERDGLATQWYKNGKKESEITYKNGEWDGLATFWYENGQKSSQATWKDGELISSKCWDEDGNEKDCN